MSRLAGNLRPVSLNMLTRFPKQNYRNGLDQAIIRDSSGNEDAVQLCDVPEFVSALELGEETLPTGVIPSEQFSSSCHSVEFNLINQLLFDGTHGSLELQIAAKESKGRTPLR